MKLTRRTLNSLLTFSLLTIATAGAQADNANWAGGGYPDGQWTNTLNWLGGVVPANPLTFSNYATADGTLTYNTDPGFYDSIVSTNWTIGRMVFAAGSGNFILSGADLVLAQAQNAAGQPMNLETAGTPVQTITISNNLLIPVATNNPASNIRHQLAVGNAATVNIYGNIVKTGYGPAQLTFRGGGGGTINVYGPVKWDTNLVSRTDASTVGFYNSGNTWTQMNVSLGNVIVGVDNALPVNSLVDFNQNSGGASFLRLSNHNQTLAFLRTSTIGNGSNTQVVDTATSGVLTLNDTGASNVFGGSIIGGGKFLKTGSGTLVTATNNSSYTGGTLIGGGRLQLGAGTTGGNITGYITNNATLIVNKTDALTLPNAISGSGQLWKLGSGTLTLPATNTYAGPTAITNGTVNLSGALTGPGNITLGGGTLQVNGQLTGAGLVNVYAGTLQVNGQVSGPPSVSVFAGTLSGTGSITGPVTVTNAQVFTSAAPYPGTLTFSNNLTLNSNVFSTYKFGGPTTIDGGANDLLDVKGSLALNNNPLNLVPVGPLTVGNTYVIATAGSALSGTFGSITNPTRYTFTTGTSGNQATLTVAGGGSSSLLWKGTNANWDLATTNWNNATDRYFQQDIVAFDDTGLSTNVSLTTVLYPQSVTVNANTNYYFLGSGRLSGATGLNKGGAGFLRVGNANDFSGDVLVSAGTLMIGNSAACGNFVGGTVISNGATLDIAGTAFNGGERVTIYGYGLNSTGAVYNSGADQTSGIFSLALGSESAVGQWPGRWDVRGTGGAGSFNGLLNLNGYTLHKLGLGKMSIVDTTFTNAGTFEVAGGTLGVTRSIITGTDPILVGTNLLQLENNSTGYVARPLVFNGGTLQLTGNSFAIGSPITNNNLILDVATNLTMTLTNVLVGTGAVTKVTAGTAFLQAPALHSGPTTISAGTLRLDAGSSLPNTPSITVASGAFFDVTNLVGGFTLTSGQKLTGSGTVFGDVNISPGAIVVPGSSPGTLTLANNANFNNSTINFELGANPVVGDVGNDLIVVGNNLTLGGVTTVNIIPTATLNNAFAYTLFQFGNLASGGAANLNVTTQSRYSFTVPDPATTWPYVQVQVTGSGVAATLLWQGGALANPLAWDLKATKNWLNGGTMDSFFSGDTVIFDDTAVTSLPMLVGSLSPASMVMSNTAFTYRFGGAGSIASGSFTNMATGSTWFTNTAANTFSGFDMEGGFVNLANLDANNFPGGLNVNAGTLGFNNAGANTFVGALTINYGMLGLGGTVGFTNGAANNFGPGVTINAGTLTMANGFANNLGSLSTINYPGVLEFAQPVNVTVANVLSGSGGYLTKSAANVLTLSANNSGFNGTVQVNSGVLRSGAASALGGSGTTVNVANGATLDVNGQNCFSVGGINIQGAGTNGAGAVLNAGADQQNCIKSLTLVNDATIGGTGRLDIRGQTASAFGGNLDLGGFKLRKVGVNKIGIADLVTPNDGIIEIVSGILALSRSQISGNLPIVIGTNILQFENCTTGWVSKPFVADRSTMQLIGNTFGIGSLVTNNGPLTVDVASGLTFTMSNTISGPGDLTKTNVGTLVLSATNTFAGTAYLQAGVLQLNDSLALGTSKSILVTNTTGVTGGVGATVDLGPNVTPPAAVTLSAYTTFSPDIRASLRALSTNEWKAPITLSGDGRFGFYADTAANQMTLSGPVSGTAGVLFVRGAAGFGRITGNITINGQFFKTDAGTWEVDSTGNIWGTTGIAVGTVRLGADNALCPTATLTMGQGDANGCILDLNGHNQTVGGLGNLGTGLRRIVNESTASDAVFTFNGTTNVSTYAGLLADNLTTNGTRKLALTVASGTLYLNGKNTNTGPTLVQSGATLGGNGSLLSAVTVLNGGTLSPGTSIGRLAISNSLVFSATSTNLVEVNLDAGTNDAVVGLTSVTYAGTLVVSNLGTTVLTNGATFKLFDSASYNGAFASIIPEVPGAGLKWDTNNLAVNGTLAVAGNAAPAPTGIAPLPDGNMRLTITGPIGMTYSVNASTNAALPVSIWQVLNSGTITISPFFYDDLTATNYSQRFYLISTP